MDAKGWAVRMVDLEGSVALLAWEAVEPAEAAGLADEEVAWAEAAAGLATAAEAVVAEGTALVEAVAMVARAAAVDCLVGRPEARSVEDGSVEADGLAGLPAEPEVHQVEVQLGVQTVVCTALARPAVVALVAAVRGLEAGVEDWVLAWLAGVRARAQSVALVAASVAMVVSLEAGSLVEGLGAADLVADCSAVAGLEEEDWEAECWEVWMEAGAAVEGLVTSQRSKSA